jgi:hypothetical protein
MHAKTQTLLLVMVAIAALIAGSSATFWNQAEHYNLLRARLQNDGDDEYDGGHRSHSLAPRTRCPNEITKQRSEQYLVGQVLSPFGWAEFKSYLSPDVVMSNNVLAGPTGITYGKAAVEQVLDGIGVLYQRITDYTPPVNFQRKNAVSATFSKTQIDIALGAGYNLSFVHTITFDDDCNITGIFEFADVSKSRESLPLFTGDLTSWLCRFLALEACVDHMPSFGAAIDSEPNYTGIGKCQRYWRSAPYELRDDGPSGSGGVFLPSKSKLCLSTQLAVLSNVPSYAPFICPLLGAPVAGLQGCW